jgi:hypothetical protein
MLIGEVGDADRVFPCQPVPGGEHRHSRFGQQRLDLQAALVLGRPLVPHEQLHLQLVFQRPDLEPRTTAAEVIEAAGRLVIPGMVDTHRHVWQGAIGGYTPQITGAGYGPAVLTGIALEHSPEDVYAGTLWGSAAACSEPTSTTCTATCSPTGSSTSSPRPRAR